MFLASQVARGHLLVRGASLGESMSQYLVDRIRALPNVEVHTQTELTQLIGEPHEGLRAVCWRDRSNGREEQRERGHVFLFIGAEPNTDWLRQCAVGVDSKGFVETGEPAATSAVTDAPLRQQRRLLETSQPGVFAGGDVRAGSMKR
jgi:thioredoxin reductase (NADPH)